MFEIKVIVEAKELTGAIEQLAEALRSQTLEPAISCQTQIGNITESIPQGVAEIQGTVAEVPENVAETRETVAEAPPWAPEKKVTRQDVQAKAIAQMDAGKQDQLQALLIKYGVQALPSIPDDKLAAFMADLEVL